MSASSVSGNTTNSPIPVSTSPIFNVKDFGAYGDFDIALGVQGNTPGNSPNSGHKDTTAIAATVVAAKAWAASNKTPAIVYFPSGNYYFDAATAGLSTTTTDISFQGSDVDQVFLYPYDQAGGNSVISMNIASYFPIPPTSNQPDKISGWWQQLRALPSIKGFTIDGSYTNTTSGTIGINYGPCTNGYV